MTPSPIDTPAQAGDLTDDDLLSLISQGDENAFTTFYNRTSARVYGLVTRILIDPAQSEEVTQEIYLEVWQDATPIRPR